MITRWPAERLNSFERFGKMMEDVFGAGVDAWTPLVDIKETPTELKFIAELPGMEEKDVEVELNGDVLTIRGNRSFEKNENKEDYVRVERAYGSFVRSFTLSHEVKMDAIKATFKNGLLTVTIPKVETRPALKIPIKGT
jgi:HSP20 family protein